MKASPHKPKRYLAKFNTQAFMAKVIAKRDALGYTWRDVQKVTGIPYPSLSHLDTGHVEAPGANMLCALMMWIDETDIGPYIIPTPLNEDGDT